MTDMTAFERQLSSEISGLMGPVRPVDDLAVFESVTAASRQKGWGFTTLSALKFVAATVIVALFGGFLLAGILTTQQGDKVAPAAVTDSPSPMTTEELLSGMVAEEVEPGVYRVANDGVRDLLVADMIIVGDDGSVWATQDQGPSGRAAFPLGGEIIETQSEPWTVTSDGTLWDESLHTYDGERWTEHPAPTTDFDADHLYNLGGTVWATWPDPQQPQQWAVARLDGDEWRRLDPLLMPSEPDETPPEAWQVELLTTDQGDLWAWTSRGAVFPEWTGDWGSAVMRRWVDGEWQEIFHKRSDQPWVVGLLALGPDGTMWLRRVESVLDEGGALSEGRVSLKSFDGNEWQEWSLDDPYYLGVLAQEGAGGVDLGGIGVAPDGGLWLGPVECWWEAETEEPHGLLRFDGGRLDRYAADVCIFDGYLGPDGSIWALSSTDPADDHAFDLYVITPEAVAGTG